MRKEQKETDRADSERTEEVEIHFTMKNGSYPESPDNIMEAAQNVPCMSEQVSSRDKTGNGAKINTCAPECQDTGAEKLFH